MSFATEIADAISEIPLEFFEPRTCEGCKSLRDNICQLWAGDCMNNPYKPYWRPQTELDFNN